MSTSNSSLSSPTRLAFDFWQNLWVADTGNNRVLMYKADRRNPELFDDGQPASLVLGQKDFTTNSAPNPPTANSLNQPGGIAFDGPNLWIADTGNNRVLLYSTWSNADLEHLFFSGQSASLVLGQRNFTSNFTRVSGEAPGSPPQDPLDASLVPAPNGIAFDADRNLWVAGWTRVLRFCFPITSSQPSSIVVGKPDFVTPDVNGGPTAVPPSQSLLWAASDVSFDQSGNMWVSDENDDRILKYDAVKDLNFYPNLFHCGQPASFVLGHMNFTHRNLDHTHASDSTLFAPQAIAFDVASDLWVADNHYNRVLRFSHPFSTLGQNATLVLGQSDFTFLDSPSPPNERSLNQPSGIAFDHSGNLWVADSGNNRILRYSRPFTSPPPAQPATKVLGKRNFTS